MDAATLKVLKRVARRHSLRSFGSDVVAGWPAGRTGRTSASRPRALSPTSSTTMRAAKMARSRKGPRRAKSPPEHVACVHSAASVARHLAKMARESSVSPRDGGVFGGGSGVWGIDAGATFVSSVSLASSAASSETEPLVVAGVLGARARVGPIGPVDAVLVFDVFVARPRVDASDVDGGFVRPGGGRAECTRSSPSASASMTGSSGRHTDPRARTAVRGGVPIWQLESVLERSPDVGRGYLSGARQAGVGDEVDVDLAAERESDPLDEYGEVEDTGAGWGEESTKQGTKRKERPLRRRGRASTGWGTRYAVQGVQRLSAREAALVECKE